MTVFRFPIATPNKVLCKQQQGLVSCDEGGGRVAAGQWALGSEVSLSVSKKFHIPIAFRWIFLSLAH